MHCDSPFGYGVALAALDAVVHIRAQAAANAKLLSSEFHLLPGETPHSETC